MTYRRADGANRLVLEFDAGPVKNVESAGFSCRMKDLSALRSTIRATSAFHHITEDDVSYLIDIGKLRTYEADATLMVQGEESHDAALIIAGQVTVIADSARGEIPIATLDAPVPCRRARRARPSAALGDVRARTR